MSKLKLDLSSEIQLAGNRIKKYARKTPLQYAKTLSRETGAEVYLKLENWQVTGSFKARGALNAVLKQVEQGYEGEFVTASTGNHAAAFAYALQVTGRQGIIYLPETVSETKRKFLEQFDSVSLQYAGTDSVETETAARSSASSKCRFISPYNDFDIIAGQGTIGLELNEQEKLDAVFVPVGGGGLISGIASYVKHNSHAAVIGCQPKHSNVMHQSVSAGEILDIPSKETISDGTAGGVEQDSITFPFCQSLVNSWVDVSEGELLDALKTIILDQYMMVEGSAALALASLRKTADAFRGKRVCLILCGNKISANLLRKVTG